MRRVLRPDKIPHKTNMPKCLQGFALSREHEQMEHIGIKERAYFKKSILDPLLAKGVIKMTLPDKPQASFKNMLLKRDNVSWL